MTAAVRYAYGSARVRARKSRLLADDMLSALATAESPALTIVGWRDLDATDDASALVALVFARLVDDYAVAMRVYPAARPVLLALVRLHEIENLKLLWRAAMGRIPFERWHPDWRPLGRLESVTADACASVASVRQLVDVLLNTPYAQAADTEFRAHPEDLAAVELALERFGSTQVLSAAAALPRRERVAQALVWSVARERDVAVVGRAVGTLGLTADLAAGMTSILGDEVGMEGIRRLAVDAAEARRTIRRTRRVACRRAFIGDPFSLASPIALLLLREGECRALLSLAEVRTRRLSQPEMQRVLEAVA